MDDLPKGFWTAGLRYATSAFERGLRGLALVNDIIKRFPGTLKSWAGLLATTAREAAAPHFGGGDDFSLGDWDNSNIPIVPMDYPPPAMPHDRYEVRARAVYHNEYGKIGYKNVEVYASETDTQEDVMDRLLARYIELIDESPEKDGAERFLDRIEIYSVTRRY